MSSTTTEVTSRAIAELAVPDLATLTDAQVEGRVCVWGRHDVADALVPSRLPAAYGRAGVCGSVRAHVGQLQGVPGQRHVRRRQRAAAAVPAAGVAVTRRVKTMEDAPLLGLPIPEPEPAPGCTACERWARERAAARAADDGARVSDCNVMMRRCTH